jgi:hypothetical protein
VVEVEVEVGVALQVEEGETCSIVSSVIVQRDPKPPQNAPNELPNQAKAKAKKKPEPNPIRKRKPPFQKEEIVKKSCSGDFFPQR